jgi:hypothetical protein
MSELQLEELRKCLEICFDKIQDNTEEAILKLLKVKTLAMDKIDMRNPSELGFRLHVNSTVGMSIKELDEMLTYVSSKLQETTEVINTMNQYGDDSI